MTMRKPSEWADRKYTNTQAKVSHWVPFGSGKALCGEWRAGPLFWLGTGDWVEIQKAESLPLCHSCREWS